MKRAIRFWGCAALVLFLAGCATTRYEEYGPPLVQEPGAQSSPVHGVSAQQESLVVLKDRMAFLEAKLTTRVADLEMVNAELATRMMSLAEQVEEVRRRLQAVQEAPEVQGTSAPQVGVLEVRSVYGQGLKDYYARRYEAAKAGFLKVLVLEPQSELADNAQYWLGEGDYALEDYPAAQEAFLKVLRYSKTEKDDDAQLMLGKCYLRLGDNENALIELKRLVVDFPECEYLGQAEALIRNIRTVLETEP